MAGLDEGRARMCISASVSYGAAAVLVTTGWYAVQQAKGVRSSYGVMAMVPLFFGIQQAFEGHVWLMLEREAASATPFALGFLFFSHFLWLWWIPLASYLVEPGILRRRIFLGLAIFGGVAGGVVYFTLLFHPGWLAVEVEGRSLVYDISPPYRGPFSIGIPPSALYGLIVLVPLLFSSHRHIKLFGVLIAIAVVLASLFYGYAFVSVWCFFAALLSLYLVMMIRHLKIQEAGNHVQ